MKKANYDDRTEIIRELLTGNLSYPKNTNELYCAENASIFYYIDADGFYHILKPFSRLKSDNSKFEYTLKESVLKNSGKLQPVENETYYSTMEKCIKGFREAISK